MATLSCISPINAVLLLELPPVRTGEAVRIEHGYTVIHTKKLTHRLLNKAAVHPFVAFTHTHYRARPLSSVTRRRTSRHTDTH